MEHMGLDIKKLYGVGEARARAYASLGIITVGDLLSHYPRGYENRGDVRLLCDADVEGKTAVLLTVALILAARESVKFSLNLANLTLPTATPKILFYDFKDYCARYLVISVILLLSAILDAVISRNLLGKISIF